MSHFLERTIRLQEAGGEITVVTKITSTENKLTIEKQGFKLIDSRLNRSGIKIFPEIKSLARLFTLLRQIKPDFLHNYGTKCILYGTLSTRFFPKKICVINNLTGLGIIFSSKKLLFLVLKVFLKIGYRFLLNPQNSIVISENKADADYFVKIGAAKRENVRIIPGAGIDISKFSPVPWQFKNQTTTAVMNARLLKSKGALVFIEAAKILDSRHVPIEMLLAGDIDSENSDSITTKDIKDNNKIKCLKFLGFRTDIDKILKRSHICVLPSTYGEGIPKSLIEGCATGLAIITTNSPGCVETVEAGNGLCIAHQDSSELANAIESLILNSNITKLMGQKSRQLAERKFDLNKINDSILRIYAELNSKL